VFSVVAVYTKTEVYQPQTVVVVRRILHVTVVVVRRILHVTVVVAYLSLEDLRLISGSRSARSRLHPLLLLLLH
jgi:hypothetical protein